MKKKIIVIKSIFILLIFLVAIIFFIWSLIYKENTKKQNKLIYIQEMEEYNEKEEKTLKEYIPKRILQTDIEGFEVIGKLEIPKIDLSTYILAQTNDKSLKKSVTKLCGPNINEVGNFCVLGHNYNKTIMFGNLKKLEINDTATLTNIYGQRIQYIVYDIYKIYPDEVECLNQETYGNRELTLITCTTGAIKRLVVKMTEIYD